MDSEQQPKRRGPSPLFDRAQRQRAADAASKPGRLADLGRGLAALIPTGVVEPPILPPLGSLDPLPALRSIPARITTPPILAELDDPETPARAAVDAVLAKVRAEDERMRRLLPAPPAGHYWEAELQTNEPDYNFTRNRADMLVRLVYRLRSIGGE